MDVEDILPGQPFEQAIDDTLARCAIALIVIGPRWAQILNQRAQEQGRDYVRHEIEAALARGMTVVPVLVGGATIALLAGLTGKLARLSRLQAVELRDNTFSEDCARLARTLGLEPRRRKKAWIALLAAAALLAVLIAALGIGPWREYRARKAAIDQILATGRTQGDRGEHESAFRTYQGLLKTDPRNREAIDLQLAAAMRWLEDFHVIAPEGGKSEEVARALLAEIMPVLDAGLARTTGQGPRTADILAHLGWAHWLNRRMAHAEFGPAAERDLRQALRIDPRNVFANAMVGNWIMQTGGRTEEALRHFQIAAEANQERPLLRQMQLGVLTYPRDAESRSALIRVANEMRRNGEPLDARQQRRILGVFSPHVNSAEELAVTLSAVPPADTRATYLWLASSEGDSRQIERDFIHAAVLEIERKREEARAAFEKLRSEVKKQGYDGRIVTHVDSALKRLSAP